MKTQRFNYLVDDEAAVLEIAALVLQERGYEVRKAKDGFQALVELRRSVPDLIISVKSGLTLGTPLIWFIRLVPSN